MAGSEGFAWVVGLMSGTSLDGIDAALIETDGETVRGFGPAATVPYPAAFRARLAAVLGRASGYAAVEAELTRRHADAVRGLLAGLPPDRPAPALVGFHGHTIDHRPDEGVTVQIGDGGALARSLGIPVVDDFRSADVAAGGQGAPLAPLYHMALLAEFDAPVAVLNLGGMANLTWVAGGQPPVAFDTGPGNALLDQWVERHTGRLYDDGGALAAGGRISEAAVSRYLAAPWFDRKPPKSVDRLDFTLDGVAGLSAADGAATLVEVTAAAVAARGPASARVAPALVRHRRGAAQPGHDGEALRPARRRLRSGRGAGLAGRCAGGPGLRLSRHAKPPIPAAQPAHDHRRIVADDGRPAAFALSRASGYRIGRISTSSGSACHARSAV